MTSRTYFFTGAQRRHPVRYVGGYQLNGTEMHSSAEVYFSDGTRRTYDPTEDKDDLPKIIVSRGRDYRIPVPCRAVRVSPAAPAK